MTIGSTHFRASETGNKESVNPKVSFWEQMKEDMEKALDQENYTLIRSLIEQAFAVKPLFPSLASTVNGESLEGYGLPRTVSTANFASREIPEEFRMRELSTCPKAILLTALTNYLVTRAKAGKFDFDLALLTKKYDDIRHQVLMPVCTDIDIINESLGIENAYQDDNTEIAAKFKANYEVIVKNLMLLKERKSDIVINIDGTLEVTPTVIRPPQQGHKHRMPSAPPVNMVPAVERKSLVSRIVSNLAKKADGYSFAFGGLGAFIGLAAAGIVIVITGGWATIPFIIGIVFGCMAAGGVLGFSSKMMLNTFAKPKSSTDFLMKHTTAKLYPHLHRKKDSLDEQYVTPTKKRTSENSYTDTPRVAPKMRFVYNKMYMNPKEEQVFAPAPRSTSRVATGG